MPKANRYRRPFVGPSVGSRGRTVRFELLFASILLPVFVTAPLGTMAHEPTAPRVREPIEEQTPRAPGHPCLGHWVGTLVASSGFRAPGTVTINDSTAACGTFVERWLPNMECQYTLSGCTFEGSTVRANARSRSGPILGGCNPVSVALSCQGNRLRFHEIGPTSTVSGTLERRPQP